MYSTDSMVAVRSWPVTTPALQDENIHSIQLATWLRVVRCMKLSMNKFNLLIYNYII